MQKQFNYGFQMMYFYKFYIINYFIKIIKKIFIKSLQESYKLITVIKNI